MQEATPIKTPLEEAGDELAELLVQLTTQHPLTYPLRIIFHAPECGYQLRQGRATERLPLGDDQRRLYVAPCADVVYDVWPVSAELVKEVAELIGSKDCNALVRRAMVVAEACPRVYMEPQLYELVEPRALEAGLASTSHGPRDMMTPLKAAQANRTLPHTKVWLQVDANCAYGTPFFRWARDAFEARLKASRARRSKWAAGTTTKDVTKLVTAVVRKNHFSCRVTEPKEGCWRVSVFILARYHNQPEIQEEFGKVTTRLVDRFTDEGLLVDLEYYKVRDPMHSVQILVARDNTVLELVRDKESSTGAV